MNDLSIQNISEDQLNTLFGEVDTPVEQSTKFVLEEGQVHTQGNEYSIPDMDIDAMEAEAATPAAEVKPEETAPAEVKPEDKPEDTPEETPTEFKEILKNTVSFFVDKGIWKDFEGREDLDLDDKTFADLALSQNQHNVEEMFNELVDSTGLYGRAILEHIKEGGNPDAIIDIFKEQKEIQSIDTSTDEGKLDLIGNYYTDVLGWKAERIQKHLKRVIAEEDLETEFQDINEQYKSHYENQVALITQEREQAKQVAVQRQREFVGTIQTTLTEMGYTDKEKKFLENSLLNIKKLPNGQGATDFNLKFASLQQDPKKLIKLVEFVMDEDNFVNKIKSAAETKAAANTFKFIKGNGTTSKKTSTPTIETNSKQSNLDFSSLLNK